MALLILLGLLIGGVQCAAIAWFFVATRGPRKTRRISVIAACYLALGILFLGPFQLLIEGEDRMGISRTSAGDAAIWSHIVALMVGVVLILRAEMRWRKEIGILK